MTSLKGPANTKKTLVAHLCCSEMQQLQLPVGLVVPNILRDEHMHLCTASQNAEGAAIDPIHLLR